MSYPHWKSPPSNPKPSPDRFYFFPIPLYNWIRIKRQRGGPEMKPTCLPTSRSAAASAHPHLKQRATPRCSSKSHSRLLLKEEAVLQVLSWEPLRSILMTPLPANPPEPEEIRPKFEMRELLPTLRATEFDSDAATSLLLPRLGGYSLALDVAHDSDGEGRPVVRDEDQSTAILCGKTTHVQDDTGIQSCINMNHEAAAPAFKAPWAP